MATSPSTLRVSVACSPSPGDAVEIAVALTSPASVWDAVRASGVLERWPELGRGAVDLGVWGRPTSAERLLSDGDRVELYRPLTMPPGEARRLRARRVAERR